MRLYKYFKPEPILLSNGKKVVPPFNWTLVIVIVLALASVCSAYITGFSIPLIAKRMHFVGEFLIQLFPVDYTYFNRVLQPMFETLAMSFIGTLIGGVCALPAAYFASSNMTKNKIVLSAIRVFLSIVRTIPILVFALIFSFMFGIGSFAGTLAIALFTFSILTKMLYDYIETVDMKPFEAIEATGASRLKTFTVTIMPQISGTYVSQLLYNFEMNVRAAAILGYVGAGGIGVTLSYLTGYMEYNRVSTVIVVLLVTVLTIEFISRLIRSRLS